MPAKVCILTTVHQPFDTRIFHKQAKTLVDAGYDVTLIAQHDRDKVVEGIKIVALPRPQNRFIRIFGLTWRAFQLAQHQKADLYHFHDPELLWVGVALKLLRRSRVIYDIHEDYPAAILTKRWLPSYLRPLVARLSGLVEQCFSSGCNAVIAVNEQILERLSHRRGLVVTNFPIFRDYLKVKAVARDRQTFTCIYHGGLTLINGIKEMLQAIRGLSKDLPVRLLLLGRLEDRELATEIEENKSVEYLGLVPHEEVWGYLQSADVGLVLYHPVPNSLWSRPNKLFEYMAIGLPVVISDLPGWREIVEENNCGYLVNPLDPQAIAETIERLYRKPLLRRQMGENGRRAVLEKYNWGREAQKLLALYEELLNEAA